MFWPELTQKRQTSSAVFPEGDARTDHHFFGPVFFQEWYRRKKSSGSGRGGFAVKDKHLHLIDSVAFQEFGAFREVS